MMSRPPIFTDRSTGLTTPGHFTSCQIFSHTRRSLKDKLLTSDCLLLVYRLAPFSMVARTVKLIQFLVQYSRYCSSVGPGNHALLSMCSMASRSFSISWILKYFGHFTIKPWILFINELANFEKSFLLLTFWVLRVLFCILSELKYFVIWSFRNPFWLFLIAPTGERLNLDLTHFKLTWLLKKESELISKLKSKFDLSKPIMDHESSANSPKNLWLRCYLINIKWFYYSH